MPSPILVTGETAVKKGQPPGAASGSYETYMLTGNDMKKELRLWKGPPLCSYDLHCLHCMDGGRGRRLKKLGWTRFCTTIGRDLLLTCVQHFHSLQRLSCQLLNSKAAESVWGSVASSTFIKPDRSQLNPS